MDQAGNEVALERPWILRAFDRIPLPYPITCLILGILMDIKWIGIGTYDASAFSFIIGTSYLIAGIPFLGNLMEKIFKQINLMHSNTEFGVYNELMKRFLHSRRYLYIFTFLIILIRWLAYFLGKFSYLFQDPYSLIVLFLSDTLEALPDLVDSLIMAYVIWIALNISWLFSELERKPSNFLKNINVNELRIFLNPLRNNIYKILSYYLILSLIISSSLIVFSYQISTFLGIDFVYHILISRYVFYIIFILFSVAYGAIFFILGLKSLNYASKWRIEYEIQDLNKLYQETFSKFRLLLTSDIGNPKSEDIDVISKSLQTLRDERDSVMKIKTEGNLW